MKFLTACLLAVMAIRTFCYADVTKLSADNRRALLDSSPFHEVSAVTNLPPAIVALCTDQNGRLAEPGQKWQVTDVVIDPKLSWRRLIWAATAGEHYVVDYERGGRGHGYCILIATFKPGDKKANVVWRGVGYCLKDFKDYKTFLTALKNSKLDCVEDDVQ